MTTNYFQKIPNSIQLQEMIDCKFDRSLSPEQIEQECNKGMYFIDRNLPDIVEEYLYFQGISPHIVSQVLSIKIECDILAHFLKDKPEQLEELNMLVANLSFLSEQPIKLQKLTRTIPFESLGIQRETQKNSPKSLIVQATDILNEILEITKSGLDLITIDYDLDIYSFLSLTQEKAQQQLDVITTYLNEKKSELDTLLDSEKEIKYKEFLESIDSNFFSNHTEDFQDFLKGTWENGLDDVLTDLAHDIKLFEIRKAHMKEQPNTEIDLRPQLVSLFDRLAAPILLKRVDLLQEMILDIKTYNKDFEPDLCQRIEAEIKNFKHQLV